MLFRRFVFIGLALILLAGCAASPTATPAPEPTMSEGETGVPTEALPPGEATPTPEILGTPGEQPTATEIPLPTQTPLPTETPTLEVTPTETLIPPIELPTEVPNAPALLYWYGNPTYPGDSLPGYVFRVIYNPDLWVPATDQWGQAVLAHRMIEYCTLAPFIGRGLSPEYTVEQDSRTVGLLTFDITRVLRDGKLEYVTYTGGDSRIVTGFQVNFMDQGNQCVADVEAILGTMISISGGITPAAP